MARAFTGTAAGWAMLAAVSLSLQGAAQAQPLQDWSLPPAPASSAPSAQGPVDPQNPVVSPTRAPATPAPVPVIDAPPPPPLARTPPERPAPARQPARTPAPSAAASPPASPPAPQAPARPAADAPIAEEQAPDAIANDEPAEPTPTPPPLREPSSWRAWWWVAAVALLGVLALGWLLARRRRRMAEPEPVAEAPEPPAAAPPAPPPALPAAAPAPGITAQASPPSNEAPTEIARASGTLDFAPVSLRISLVYATLRFRLTVTAGTVFPAGRMLAGMISAHGSLPRDEQLAPPPEALASVGNTPPLQPGQALEIEGDLQLPLASVRPLQEGGAAFLVPLVRLAWLGDNEPGLPHLELGCAFTVGLPREGAALAPLRLDTGPRDFTGLATREIEAARRTALLPLDPARAAG